MILTMSPASQAAEHHQQPPCKMPSWPCDIDTRSIKSRSSGHHPPSPCQMPSWPCDIDGTFSHTTQAQQFVALAHIALDRQEYLDSLIAPSSEQIIRIAGLQAIKEAEIKRRNRIRTRTVSEASFQGYQPHSFLPLQDSRIPEQHDGQGHAYLSTSSTPHLAGPAIISSKYNRSKRASTFQQNAHHGVDLSSQPKTIDASTRWTEAIREARFRLLTAPRSRTGLTPDFTQVLPPGSVIDEMDSGLLASLNPKPLTARQRWKKAIAVACRAGFDPYAEAGSDIDVEEPGYSSEMDYISSAVSIIHSDSAYDSNSDSDHDNEIKTKQSKARQQKQKEEAKAVSKLNELYLLEVVDIKHRYGINLFLYHEEWKRAPTNENFFFWLDYGAGRYLDLAEEGCPREKLEREQIRYLSFEEQELYRVVGGSGGRLCWAKNGVPVDTDSMRWRDSVKGIVPLDDPAPEWVPDCQYHYPHRRRDHLMDGAVDRNSWSANYDSVVNSRVGSSWSQDSTFATSLSSSGGNHDHAEHHNLGGDKTTPDSNHPFQGATASNDTHRSRRKDSNHQTTTTNTTQKRSKSQSQSQPPSLNKLKYGSSPASHLLDKFLRQQWGSKPWIFISDSAGRLYIGIKDSGSFQHTSFVRGSRVSAAGMISVREGKITALSPLSGHYRPPTKNFRAFVRVLREGGVSFGGSSESQHDGTRGRRRRFGEEMKLCYGHDYWLLRGFEIYSGVRNVLHGRKAESGSEVGQKGHESTTGKRNKSRGRLLSMKSMASLLTMDKSTGKASVDEESRTKGHL